MTMLSPVPGAWLRWAVLYLVAGVVLGNYMGATQEFAARSVHAHLNLLGWASMALAGLVYKAYPGAGATRLAKAHFWIQVAAMPVSMFALWNVMRGNPSLGPVLGATGALLGLGWILFAINLFRTVRD